MFITQVLTICKPNEHQVLSIYCVFLHFIITMNLTSQNTSISMSSSSFLTIFTTYITLFTLLHISNANSNQTDLLALREIKAQIRQDPLGIMSTWNDTLHFCEWRGVFCGHHHKRVTKLDLRSSNLTSFLSPHMG